MSLDNVVLLHLVNMHFHLNCILFGVMDHLDQVDGFYWHNPIHFDEFYFSFLVELALCVVHEHTGTNEEPRLEHIEPVLFPYEAVILINVRLFNLQ